MLKEDLRKRFLEVRNSIDDRERSLKSLDIAKHLFDMPEYNSARSIFLYLSIGSEVDTKPIFDRAKADGKRISVPLCVLDKRCMELYFVESYDDLDIGSYKIYEPKKDLILSGKLKQAAAEEVDISVVPGVCFDFNGNRIGYGGGYYDKFLSTFKGVSVGITYDCCMTEEICPDKYDAPVDIVLTESGAKRS